MKKHRIFLLATILIFIYSFVIHPVYAYFFARGGIITYFISIAVYALFAFPLLNRYFKSLFGESTLFFAQHFPKKSESVFLGLFSALWATVIAPSFQYVAPLWAAQFASFVATFTTLFFALFFYRAFSIKNKLSHWTGNAFVFVFCMSLIFHWGFIHTPLMAAWLDEAYHVDTPSFFAKFFMEFGTLDDWSDQALKEYEHYGPTGTPIAVMATLLFGNTVEAFRFFQLLFSFLTSISIFKLLKQKTSERFAFIASTLMLFLPSSFFFAGRAMLVFPLIFFMNESVRHFLEFENKGQTQSLLLSSLFLTIGYLYRKDALLIIPIFVAYIILYRKKEWQQYLPLFSIFGVIVAPYLILKQVLNRNGYGALSTKPAMLWSPMETHYSDCERFAYHRLTFYLEALPYQLTIPLAIMFLYGYVTSFKKKRKSPLLNFSQLYVFLWWLGFNFNYVQVGRYMLPLLAQIMYFALLPIKKQIDYANSGKLTALVILSFVVFGTFSTDVAFNAGPAPIYYIGSPTASDIRIGLPIEDVVLYLGEVNSQKILSYQSYYGFYMRQHGVSFELETLNIPKASIVSEDPLTYAKQNGIDHIVLAVGKQFYFNDDRWVESYKNLISALRARPENFHENEFSYRGNKILVFEVIE